MLSELYINVIFRDDISFSFCKQLRPFIVSKMGHIIMNTLLKYRCFKCLLKVRLSLLCFWIFPYTASDKFCSLLFLARLLSLAEFAGGRAQLLRFTPVSYYFVSLTRLWYIPCLTNPSVNCNFLLHLYVNVNFFQSLSRLGISALILAKCFSLPFLSTSF